MSRALLTFLRHNRSHLGQLLLAGVLINLLSLALPVFSMLIYDKAVGNEIHATLWVLAVGMLLALGLELCVRISRVLFIEHAGARWDAHLDSKLLQAVLNAPLSRPMPVGAVISRYRDLGAARDALSAQCLLPLADLPFAVLFAGALVVIGGPLVLIPLVMGLLLFALGAAFSSVSQHRQRTANAAHGRKLTLLVDVLLARESLTLPAAAAAATAAFKPAVIEGSRAGARSRFWSQLIQQVTPVGLAFTTVAVMVLGVFRVESQQLSVGGMISGTMLAGRLVALLCGLAPVVGRWREFQGSLAELQATVDLHAHTMGAVDTRSSPPEPDRAFCEVGLRADGLVFRYPGQQRNVIDGISVQANEGELIAIVGSSGAGKSTLLRLLAGRLAPLAGQLTVGGEIAIDDAARQRIAARVSLKPQEPVFLPGTVRGIVDPGRSPDARPDDEADALALRSLRAAGLGPAVERGDIGLNTPVGSQGQGLSGGQKQMLALARALHVQSPVLLLDEPTLGLDSRAQETLITHLAARPRTRCVIVATHTTELISRCDRVWVLDRGKLVADLPPERLLAKGPHRPSRVPAGDREETTS